MNGQKYYTELCVGNDNGCRVQDLSVDENTTSTRPLIQSVAPIAVASICGLALIGGGIFVAQRKKRVVSAAVEHTAVLEQVFHEGDMKTSTPVSELEQTPFQTPPMSSGVSQCDD
jgi:hypothetical protein